MSTDEIQNIKERLIRMYQINEPSDRLTLFVLKLENMLDEATIKFSNVDSASKETFYAVMVYWMESLK